MKLKKGLMLFILAAALFTLDFFSKSYVYQNIPLIGRGNPFYPYGGIPIFHDFLGINFSIVLAMNKGAAWGVFASFQVFLLYFRMIVTAALIIYGIFFNKDRFRDLPFTLIITGAIGNVVDFFLYGQVVDMFYFTFGSYSYPIFNIADSAIFCGVALLLLKPFIKKLSFSLWKK